MKALLIIILVLAGIASYAQERSTALFGFSYSREKIHHDSIRGYSNNAGAFLNFPILRGKNQTLGGRLQFKSRTIRDVNPSFNHRLYAADLNLFWQWDIKENKKLYIFTQPGIYSDFSELSAKDWRYTLGARYIVRHNGKLQTGWGLAYSRQYFGNQLNPFFSLDYEIMPKLRLSGLLPIRPKLSFAFSNQVSLSAELYGSASSYRLSAAEDNNRFIRINQWYGLSSLAFNLHKHHQLSLGLGYSLRQSLRLYEDGAGKNWSIFTFDLGRKAQPVAEIKSKGAIIEATYSFSLK